MSAELAQIITQAPVVVSLLVMFGWYLNKRDKRELETINKFNTTIVNYLEKETEAKKKLAEKMQLFSDTNKELRNVVQQMYEFNLKQAKTIQYLSKDGQTN